MNRPPNNPDITPPDGPFPVDPSLADPELRTTLGALATLARHDRTSASIASMDRIASASWRGAERASPTRETLPLLRMDGRPVAVRPAVLRGRWAMRLAAGLGVAACVGAGILALSTARTIGPQPQQMTHRAPAPPQASDSPESATLAAGDRTLDDSALLDALFASADNWDDLRSDAAALESRMQRSPLDAWGEEAM